MKQLNKLLKDGSRKKSDNTLICISNLPLPKRYQNLTV